MDIRLKNLTRRQTEILLAAGWLIVSMTITFADIFSVYSKINYYWSGTGIRFYMVSSVILTVLSVIFFTAAAVLTVMYMRKWNPLEDLTLCRLDRCKTEVLIVLLVFGGCKWWWILTTDDVYLSMGFGIGIDRIVVNGPVELIQMSVVLLIDFLCFYGSCILLVRQKKLGIMQETSIILSAVRKYQTRTPLELRIQRRNKRTFTVITVITAVIGFTTFMQGFSYGNPFGWGQGVLSLILWLVYLKSWLSNKTARETGYLLRQIEAMSQGEAITEEMQLPERSLLYDASEQLKNIEKAMQKSVEKQVQAERLKIDLITNVSHDLKTPLTSMVGYTDLLKKEALSDEAKDYVEVISLKQEQLKNMIQDLFELSKATSGSDQLQMETLDMRKLLEQTLGDMEDAVQESGQEIRTQFSEEPLLFVGDNGKMYRVVQNLLENALKYSLSGTRIYIQAEKRDGRIEMQIKNIASYEMDFSPDEITERFVRGDKSRTTEGHGLGLAIASGFVRNMGGTLEVGIDGDLFKVTLRFPETGAE